MINIKKNWIDFKNIVISKNLLMQYDEFQDKYALFATDSHFMYMSEVWKNGEDAQQDFEANFKSTANKPLEYRSVDGLPKIASSKFADQLSFWLDGTAGKIDVPAETTVYMKKHFDFPYTLSGVDLHWYDANWGDDLDFCVGIYTDVENEASFIQLSQFADDYYIYKDGNRIVDVPTVTTISPTVVLGGTTYDVYIRIKCENVGPTASKILIRLVGWK